MNDQFKSLVDNENITVINDAGLLETEKGKLTLNNFRPDTTTAIKITVVPDSLDIAPSRDQLLSIENGSVSITPEIDTIAVSGSSGAVSYTTTSRIK